MQELPIYIQAELLILCEPEVYNLFIRTCKVFYNLSCGKIEKEYGNLTEYIYERKCYYDFSSRLYNCREKNELWKNFYRMVYNYERFIECNIKFDLNEYIADNRFQEFKILTNICIPDSISLGLLKPLFKSARRSPILSIDFNTNKLNAQMFYDKKHGNIHTLLPLFENELVLFKTSEPYCITSISNAITSIHTGRLEFLEYMHSQKPFVMYERQLLLSFAINHRRPKTIKYLLDINTELSKQIFEVCILHNTQALEIFDTHRHEEFMEFLPVIKDLAKKLDKKISLLKKYE